MKSFLQKVILSFLAFFCYFAWADAPDHQKLNDKRPLIGIIIPLEDESLLIQKSITDKKNLTLDGVNYSVGKIHNKNVVFVLSGFGRANSAIISARLINDFHPDLILMSATSGGIDPAVNSNTVVIGETVINADLGVLTDKGTTFEYPEFLYNPHKKANLPLEFKLDPAINQFLEARKKQWPHVIMGKIASSDALPNPPAQVKLLEKAKISVIEMEGASLMQACWLFNTSCVVIRGVSNNVKQPITRPELLIAADNAAKVTLDIIAGFE